MQPRRVGPEERRLAGCFGEVRVEPAVVILEGSSSRGCFHARVEEMAAVLESVR